MVEPPTGDTMQTKRFSFGGPLFDKGQECAHIVRSLPDWLGIEEYITSYSADIDSLPTWLAWDSGQLIGFLSIKQHYAASAELYGMGVRREWQRQGIGRELLRKAEDWLKAKSCEYIQVKTLGASCDDENYARTRIFYEAMGFRPLEEFDRIWDEHNPCLIMIKRL